MEKKFTKGEWDIVHSESKPAVNVIGTVLGGKYKIARCPYIICEDTEITERDRKEALANAKLIAAAPDLLEALEELHGKTLYKLDASGKRDTHMDYELFDKVEAALRKALD